MPTSGLIIVMAMPEEAQAIFSSQNVPVVFTGLGKVNATYKLMRALNGKRPKAVINFGTAGSPKYPTHSLIECTRFVQRDIDLSALGFQAGLTPFEDTPAVLEVPKRFIDLETGACGTGDSFETGTAKVKCDVVDMEAYALAKVCYLEKIPFLSIKYISDGSDQNASNDWSLNLPRAAAHFGEIYKRLGTIF